MPKVTSRLTLLEKVPTGINGFDEITGGGLPAGRPTLVCGSAGCGKSLFGLEFLVRGATQYNEPGVLMTFEESADDIRKNVASLGFDIDALVAKKKLIIDFVRIERGEIEEHGEYDLEGLFIRLAHSIARVDAKRVVLDTIEALFAGLSNEAILRSELRRLFGWLKERGLTTVITGERTGDQFTRQGLEEFISDCVILLDHRVVGQISTRRLRVVKYRGSTHGTNEYPFLIDENGISILPISSSSLEYEVSAERVGTGIRDLDEMLGGLGYYRGSTVLLSGTAGTGKTTLAAHLAQATCARGERCLFFSFEESASQILRNMRTIGIDLQPFIRKELLRILAARPTVYGLEMHLVRMHKLISQFQPAVVIVDPVSNLQTAGTSEESSALFIRLVDFLRKNGILGFLVSLTGGASALETTGEGISSIVDTWLLLRDIELSGERNKVLYVLKSRGMNHSNQVREFHITSKGVKLVDAYLGPAGVLTGSARLAQEAREGADAETLKQEMERRELALKHRRRAMESQIEALRAAFEAEIEEFNRTAANEKVRLGQVEIDREVMARSRRVTERSKENNHR
ncbi:MAG: circadian clock protein KaiC [Verrucomicrobia bacterium]|nr:circadian clock protein KaiC [Verrucomicrobiota bacterium]